MQCPECQNECGRDEVDVGAGIIYGPYGCLCGFSEDSRYCHNKNLQIDSRDGFRLEPKKVQPFEMILRILPRIGI